MTYFGAEGYGPRVTLEPIPQDEVHLYALAYAFSNAFYRQFPCVLKQRTWMGIIRRFQHHPGGIDALLTASDADLLRLNGFGPAMLADFRQYWPGPGEEA